MFSPRTTEDLNVTYHRHTLDRLCLLFRTGRLEPHVVVLQYAKAERANRVLRRQHPPVCQGDRDTQVGVLDRRNGRVEEHLRELEKLGGVCLDEVLEPALVCREEVVVRESSFVNVVRKIVSL